jgi:hypothetical protein
MPLREDLLAQQAADHLVAQRSGGTGPVNLQPSHLSNAQPVLRQPVAAAAMLIDRGL